MVSINIDQVHFCLQTEHDFSWLQQWGTVFAVFDQQDSGNICFGVQDNGVRRFVKYAGALTPNYSGEPKAAIERLAKAVLNYQDLQHPYLTKFLRSIETAEGFGLLFDWFNGECLHSHWLFTPEEKYTHPDSPNYRFNHLSLEQRLAAFEQILEFHTYVEAQGYVAIDFYDGSILYDFQRDELRICDIDFYAKRPYNNHMGRMWGSKRFMSPEEFERGALIDEKTNVFNMGAMAFSMLGGALDRSFEKWQGKERYYQVALKAVSEKRADRYASVEELYREWVGVGRENRCD